MSDQTFQSKSDDRKPCRVLLFCRSSGEDNDRHGDNQMGKQEVQLRDWVNQNISEPFKIDTVKCNDRIAVDAMHVQLLEALHAGRHDLIVVSSLDRIGRGLNLVSFLELAALHQVRIIAVADGFDSTKHELEEHLDHPSVSECN